MPQTPIEAKSSASSTVNSIFNFLSRLLNSMPSAMYGWDVGDVKVKQDGDNFSSYFQFEHSGTLTDTRTNKDISNVAGDVIQLDVLLRTSNAKSVLSPIMAGLNNMSQNELMEGKALLNVLFGDPNADKKEEPTQNPTEQPDEEPQDNGQPAEEQGTPTDSNSSTRNTDDLISIFGSDSFDRFQYSRTNGVGLLGVDFEKVKTLKDLSDQTYTFDNKEWSWLTIANDFLRYGLECQIPGGDYGAIDNITLPNCSARISDYLVDQGVIDDASEVKADTSILVLPILGRMQGFLIEYFDAAYKRNPGIQEVEDADTKAFEEANNKKKQSSNNTENPAEEQGGADESDQQSTEQQNNQNSDAGQSWGADMEDFGMSKHISVKLKKITASDEIQLLGLGSNYLPSETLDDLEDIIYQDEFIDALTGDSQSFNIDVDDDGYDIEQCEDCAIDPCDSIWSVMQNGIVMYRNLYMLHWMAKGNDMMKLHLLTEEMYEELINEIDTLGELMVEKCGTVRGLDFEWTPIATRNYGFQEGLDILKDFIQNYIDTIDYAYPNQTSDVQSTLDEWLRYWNKQMNYFIKNQEE